MTISFFLREPRKKTVNFFLGAPKKIQILQLMKRKLSAVERQCWQSQQLDFWPEDGLSNTNQDVFRKIFFLLEVPEWMMFLFVSKTMNQKCQDLMKIEKNEMNYFKFYQICAKRGSLTQMFEVPSGIRYFNDAILYNLSLCGHLEELKTVLPHCHTHLSKYDMAINGAIKGGHTHLLDWLLTIEELNDIVDEKSITVPPKFKVMIKIFSGATKYKNAMLLEWLSKNDFSYQKMVGSFKREILKLVLEKATKYGNIKSLKWLSENGFHFHDMTWYDRNELMGLIMNRAAFNYFVENLNVHQDDIPQNSDGDYIQPKEPKKIMRGYKIRKSDALTRCINIE